MSLGREVHGEEGLLGPAGETGVAFRILGSIEVATNGGRRVTIEGRRARMALGMLLVQRNQLVSTDALIDGLWGDEPPAHATATLHAYISKLRRAVGGGVLSGGERIVRRAPGYQLVTLDGEVDADRLERALALAEAAMRDGQFAAASASLRQGLQLVRGPLLGECRDEPFARGEVARLEGIRLRAIERRVDAELALGQHAALVGDLERLISEHGLHERFHEQLMLALYRGGRQADALQVYQQAYRLLGEELGLLPGPGLRGMEAAILAQDPALEMSGARVTVADRATGTGTGTARDGRGRRDVDPFVGRERELDVLRDAWKRAAAGERQLVVIEADLGLGATRLATEMADGAAESGAAVLIGRTASQALIPYLPFVEALGDYVTGLAPNELQLIAGAGAPFLADLFPGLGATGFGFERPRMGEAGAGSNRYLLFEAVATLLNAVADPAGAVLVLDDVHDADPSTLQLLEHLARHRSRGRLLIVATSSGAPSASPARALWTRLVAEGLAIRVVPQGLSVDEVAQVLGTVTGRGDGALPVLAATVHEITSGIPLFVTEMGKGLAELDARTVLAVTDLPVPERVRATLDRRIDQVPPVVASVLSAAAVCGQTFDAEVLAALTHQSASALDGHLDTAVAAGLLRPDGPGRYRFPHRLLHQALDHRVGPTQRGELHGDLANLLAGAAAPRGTTPAEVAHHFRLAAIHHAEQAVAYAVRAGDQAMAVLAFEDAEQFYGSALETLRGFGSGADRRQEARVLLALGHAHHAAYHRLDAIAVLRQAAELFLGQSDRDGLAAAAWGLMISTEFSVAEPDVVALFRRALAACEDRTGLLGVRLTAGLARVLPAGDPEAFTLVAGAIDAARRLGDPETTATVLAAAVLITWSPDNLQWRQDTAAEVIDLAGSLGWVELAMEARNWRAAGLEEQADLAGADADLAAVESYAEESRRPFFCGLAAMRRADRAVLAGRYADAEVEGTRMLSFGGDSPDFVAGYGAQLLLVRRDQGRLRELEPIIAEYISTSQVPAWQVARVMCLAALGRTEEARAALRLLAVDGIGALPRDWLWLLPATLLADVCVELADGESAPGLIAALTPFEDRMAVLGHGIAATGAVAGPLGRLEALAGDEAGAERHFCQAIEADRRVGAVPALVRTELAYARLLDGRSAGSGEAASLREDALGLAAGIGMDLGALGVVAPR